MAKGDNIEDRLIEFAVRVIRVCDSLPDTGAGRHLSGQLLRSGTSPAAHYAEARGAESTKDLVHKLRICLKELNESQVWLKIIGKSDLLSETRPESITQECNELCRTINASIKTTREKTRTMTNNNKQPSKASLTIDH